MEEIARQRRRTPSPDSRDRVRPSNQVEFVIKPIFDLKFEITFAEIGSLLLLPARCATVGRIRINKLLLQTDSSLRFAA